ncbi:hypothetical protein FA95DRAFT_1610964 [Auriscalpium vulgare]|uniref:Uncharacterized protein n=1 Tax=Auriscalpium vulgare TaxID=40419 RepID=A0ACB8RC23_9AGAM|nr:hypothetical protein FA95DRAFT_1610964 [Auriscalpium vulgare]
MSHYQELKLLHKAVPAFSPLLPVALLPYVAFVVLTATFGLAFYFSTLPKSTVPVRESAVAVAASLLGGLGVVALFNTVGVYV